MWDYWTRRAAVRAADALNASAVARGASLRYDVQRMP